MNHLLATVSTLSLAAAAVAQVPSPDPIPRTAPRAEWAEVTGVTGAAPAGRANSQGAYSDDKLFVFAGRTWSGSSYSTYRNDLHSFDTTTATWTLHTADGDPGSPPQRWRNGATWVPGINRLVVFGGNDGTNYLGDTWEWDQATNTWANATPMVLNPTARGDHRIAYEPTTGGVLLFGGNDGSSTRLGDTWLYIPSATFGLPGVWAPITPAVSPGNRSLHSLVTRPDFNDVFLCAGSDFAASPNRIHYTDTWRFDGSNWIQIPHTTANIPHGVLGNEATYDPIRQRIVLQGGNGISNSSAATGGAYGTEYGGSPSTWCSEFDCVTNEWKLYGAATFSTADPIIGRASRYYIGFCGGKIHMFGGQNPSGVGISLTRVKSYQANPLASTGTLGSGCNGLSLVADNDPWTTRAFSFTVNGIGATSLVSAFVGFALEPGAPLPLSLVFPGSCGEWYVQSVVDFGLVNTGTGSSTFLLPISDSVGNVNLTPYIHVLTIDGSTISSTNVLTMQVGAM